MTTHSDQNTHEHPSLEEPRPGHELRTARERAGISRESIAERLRLASDQLDALEHDDYSELPPPAFVRGYFRAYARELGVDPDEYIAAYNRSGVSATDPEIRRGGVTETPSSGRGGLIGLLLIALVAAGGIGAWWYQQRMDEGNGDSGATDSLEEESTAAGDSSADTDTPAAASGDTDTDETAASAQGTSDEAASGGGDTDAAGATVAAAEGSDEDAADDVDGADASGGSREDGETANNEAEQPVVAAMDPESSASDGEGGAVEATEPADAGDAGDAGNASRTEDDADDIATAEETDNDAGADSTAAAAEPGATSPAATDSPTRAATDAASSGPDRITLGFSSRSWLEVYDDRDRELVYTLYFGSEPITLQGWAPFEIFLGNSPAVTVELNGEEIDKSAFTRSNNTARFVVDASGVRAP
jgi:cytoskeleton protein RodZ